MIADVQVQLCLGTLGILWIPLSPYLQRFFFSRPNLVAWKSVLSLKFGSVEINTDD